MRRGGGERVEVANHDFTASWKYVKMYLPDGTFLFPIDVV
jgi:hypothetical protein